jgi:hypothetical protein
MRQFLLIGSLIALVMYVGFALQSRKAQPAGAVLHADGPTCAAAVQVAPPKLGR